jgi:CRISPR-associated endoribonuclease Cas6
VWFGSPVPEIAACLLEGLSGRTSLQWGSTRLRVLGVAIEPPTDRSGGSTAFSTVSPILIKYEDRYLLPGDEYFEDRLLHNIRHKADVLGLPGDAEVEIEDAGPRRMFQVQRGLRIGATVRVRVYGHPQLLDALADCGLGLCNVQGFGWVR